MDLLHLKGKVHMMIHRLEEDGPEIRLLLKGRNEATTFTGLCSKHDAELFEPIDNHEARPDNVQQMFLCAYRSVLRELHILMEASAQSQGMLRTAIEKGVETEACDGPIGNHATMQMMYSYKFYLYKVEKFDRNYASKTYDDLVYDSFIINHEAPTVAVSSVYSLLPFTSPEYAPTIFNIFPISKQESIVSFCYAKEHAALGRSLIKNVLHAKGDYQKYELSRLIIAHTENFVLSPSFVDLWSPEKRDVVERAYRKTAGRDSDVGHSAEMMLFT